MRVVDMQVRRELNFVSVSYCIVGIRLKKKSQESKQGLVYRKVFDSTIDR